MHPEGGKLRVMGDGKSRLHGLIPKGVTECSNHRKYVPHHRIDKKTACYFEPHRALIKEMLKQERKHQEITSKHMERLSKEHATYNADGILPLVVLARIIKKWSSLAKKLKKLTTKITTDDR